MYAPHFIKSNFFFYCYTTSSYYHYCYRDEASTNRSPPIYIVHGGRTARRLLLNTRGDLRLRRFRPSNKSVGRQDGRPNTKVDASKYARWIEISVDFGYSRAQTGIFSWETLRTKKLKLNYEKSGRRIRPASSKLF